MSGKITKVLNAPATVLDALHKEMRRIWEDAGTKCNEAGIQGSELCDGMNNSHLTFEFAKMSQKDEFRKYVGDIQPLVSTFQTLYQALDNLDLNGDGTISANEVPTKFEISLDTALVSASVLAGLNEMRSQENAPLDELASYVYNRRETTDEGLRPFLACAPVRAQSLAQNR